MERKEYPEKEMNRYNTLNPKNLYRLLIFLRNIYPIGYSLKGIKRELDIEILTEKLLKDLVEEGFIKKRCLSSFEKTMLPNKLVESFPEYAIANNGMQFINSVESNKLNKSIELLTRVLILLGMATVFYALVQNLFTLWF